MLTWLPGSLPLVLVLLLASWPVPGCSGGGEELEVPVEEEDPILTTPFDAKLTASDAAEGDLFGFAVSLEGDSIAVGSARGSSCDNASCVRTGAVYVFERDLGDATLWNEVARLSDFAAAPPGENDAFGFSLALDGDRLAVGAPQPGCDVLDCDPAGPGCVLPPSDCGRVYVFERSTSDPSVWEAPEVLSVPGCADAFGFSVALDGDTLVVGAPESECDFTSMACGDPCVAEPCDPEPACGAAFVYEYDGNGDVWTGPDRLTAATPAVGDAFGFAVAISVDRIVVGAPGRNEGCPQQPGLPGCGATVIFKPAGNTWVESNVLVPALAGSGDGFGSALALDAATLGVGAPFSNGACVAGTLCSSGAVHVFERDAADEDAWNEGPRLAPEVGDPFDRFGVAVAIAGDTLALGADGDDALGTNAGAVYVHERDDGEWPLFALIVPDDAEPRDLFGASLAVDAATLLVGAFREDEACPVDPECELDCEIQPSCNPGAAYVFELE